jgi:hypothetical protein
MGTTDGFYGPMYYRVAHYSGEYKSMLVEKMVSDEFESGVKCVWIIDSYVAALF